MDEQQYLFAPDEPAVEPIPARETYRYLLDVHYARRIPSISHAYGLFAGGELVGVVTYGRPSSPPLRVGVAGEDRAEDVWELNRLCLRDNLPNQASMLVGRSLRLLPGKPIVVSYADPSKGHVGLVYQATNFVYTGLSVAASDWAVDGLGHLHGVTVADMSRGRPNRAEWMRETFGDRLHMVERPRKHRYVWCRDRRDYGRVRYPRVPYPKSVQPDISAG
jgi:hypothetical protein